MEQQIKISAYITLDNEKEKDLIEAIEKLKDSRQLSNFVTNVVKFSLENPSILDQAHIDSSKVLMANSRLKFFEEIKQSLIEMDSRIEKIKEVITKTYELGRLGKKIGLEGKAKNELMAQFILKRHMNELKKSLGYSEYEFNRRLNNAESESEAYINKAEELLEYVIEHYDGIVQEIVASQTVESKESDRQILVDEVAEKNQSLAENEVGEDTQEVIVEAEERKEVVVEDEPVKLDLDISALTDFFS